MNRAAVFLLLFLAACSRTETAPATDGRALVAQYNCTMCHAIPGVQGGGMLGPALAGIGSRPTISMGAVQNTPENLARFIQNPASVNPRSSMPPSNAADADARAMAEFLLSLK